MLTTNTINLKLKKETETLSKHSLGFLLKKIESRTQTNLIFIEGKRNSEPFLSSFSF
jgi:hypothetical protein